MRIIIAIIFFCSHMVAAPAKKNPQLARSIQSANKYKNNGKLFDALLSKVTLEEGAGLKVLFKELGFDPKYKTKFSVKGNKLMVPGLEIKFLGTDTIVLWGQKFHKKGDPIDVFFKRILNDLRKLPPPKRKTEAGFFESLLIEKAYAVANRPGPGKPFGPSLGYGGGGTNCENRKVDKFSKWMCIVNWTVVIAALGYTAYATLSTDEVEERVFTKNSECRKNESKSKECMAIREAAKEITRERKESGGGQR